MLKHRKVKTARRENRFIISFIWGFKARERKKIVASGVLPDVEPGILPGGLRLEFSSSVVLCSTRKWRPPSGRRDFAPYVRRGRLTPERLCALRNHERLLRHLGHRD